MHKTPMFCCALRSEIAWREARYAQIYEYLREEYEVTQRFGNLDFKLKFVEVLVLHYSVVFLSINISCFSVF